MMSIGSEVFLLVGKNNIPRNIIRAWFMEVVGEGGEIKYFSSFFGQTFDVGDCPVPYLEACAKEWPPLGDDLEVPTARKMGLWLPAGGPQSLRGEVVGWHVGFRFQETYKGVTYVDQTVEHIALKMYFDGVPRVVHARCGYPCLDAENDESMPGYSSMSNIEKMAAGYDLVKRAFPLGDVIGVWNNGRRLHWSKETEAEAFRNLGPVAPEEVPEHSAKDFSELLQEFRRDTQRQEYR